MRSPATTPAVIARVARFLRRGAFAVVVTVRSLAGGACAKTGRSLAVPYGSDRLDRVVERRDREDLHAVGDVPDDLVAVGLRREEPLGPRLSCTLQLLPDPADGADLALGVDRSRARDPLPAGQRAGGE